MRHFVLQKMIRQFEIVFIIQYVQVFYDFLISQIAVCIIGCLVEDGKSVAHSAVGFLCNDVQCFGFVGVTFFLSYILQVVDNGLHAHPVEVVYLAAAQNCGKNLVLLCSGQNEDDV